MTLHPEQPLSLRGEPWVLDVESTIKALYGHQEGAVVGYNPHEPGRPSHCHHIYLKSNPRLLLGVEVPPGDEHTPKHAMRGLWWLLERPPPRQWLILPRIIPRR